MERLREQRHRREGRRLSEREASESNLSTLSVLQHVGTEIIPSRVQSINEADFLCSRPLLQLRFTGDHIADVTIVFIVNQFLALIFRSKSSFNCLAVLPGSAREPVSHPDVKDRVVTIRKDVDPKIVITRHRSELKFRDVSTSLDMTFESQICVHSCPLLVKK